MRRFNPAHISPFVLMLIILPVVANYMMYFTTAHINSGLNRPFEEIYQFYQITVFRSRPIGIEVVKWVYEVLHTLGIGASTSPHTGGATGTVLWAFYLVNTFFNFLTGALFYLHIRKENQGILSPKEIQLYSLIVIFIISITQFVVTPL